MNFFKSSESRIVAVIFEQRKIVFKYIEFWWNILIHKQLFQVIYAQNLNSFSIYCCKI